MTGRRCLDANPLPLTPRSRIATRLVLGLSLAALSTWALSSRIPPAQFRVGSLATLSPPFSSDPCPQPTPITPQKHTLVWEGLLQEAVTEEYKKKATEWLSGSIQIMYVCSCRKCGSGVLILYHVTRTESYDNMGPVGEDPRWEAFGPFHDYLFNAFPRVCVILVARLAHRTQSEQALDVVCLQGQHLGIGVRLERSEQFAGAAVAHRTSRSATHLQSRTVPDSWFTRQTSYR